MDEDKAVAHYLGEFVNGEYDLIDVDCMPNDAELLRGMVRLSIHKYKEYICVACIPHNMQRYKDYLVVPRGTSARKYRKQFLKDVLSGLIRVRIMKEGSWSTISSYKTHNYKISNPIIANEWNRKIKRCKKLSEAGSKINVNLLLHGEPGTGKTQFATDIAVLSEMDLHIVDISNCDSFTGKGDGECVFLIEEIDKVLMPDGSFISEIGDRITLLLQFLDGILRPLNSVVMVTCNDLARVKANKVLSRPGRITRYIEFGYTSEIQCQTLSESRYPGEDYRRLWAIVEPLKVTIAELSLYVNDAIVDEVPFDDMLTGVKSGLTKNKSSIAKSSLYY